MKFKFESESLIAEEKKQGGKTIATFLFFLFFLQSADSLIH